LKYKDDHSKIYSNYYFRTAIKILPEITRQATADYREVSRASLILVIGNGKPNYKIAETMSCSIPKVTHWRLK